MNGTRVIGLVVAAVMAGAAPVAGQHWHGGGWGEGGYGSASASVLIARPLNEFALDVGTHGGFGGALTLGGGVGIRFSGSLLIYGHESQSVPLSGTGGRVYFDLNTDNIIGTLAIGPQITLGGGPMRLYGWGSLGLGYIATVSSARDDCWCDDAFASSTNFDDVSLMKEVGGGLQIRLGGRRNPVFLDLSARYADHGIARYLTEGGIYEAPDGTLRMDVRQARVEMVVYQVGVTVGLR